MVYVIDANVAAKWFIPEVHYKSANRLRNFSDQLYAPEYFMVEFAALVSKKFRRGEMLKRRANELFQLVKSTPIQLQPWQSCFERACELSLEHQQSFYDFLYFSLAEMMEGQFVTADEQFLNGLPNNLREEHCLWVEDIPEEE